MTIVIVDTSILLNILAVPGRAQHRQRIRKELERLVEDRGVTLLLPLVALVETSNHIAQLNNGAERRRLTERLVEITRQALHDEAPWSLVPFPDREDLEALLEKLPDLAMHELGFADASIVAIWERQCRRWQVRRIKIWSMDGHLSSFDRHP